MVLEKIYVRFDDNLQFDLDILKNTIHQGVCLGVKYVRIVGKIDNQLNNLNRLLKSLSPFDVEVSIDIPDSIVTEQLINDIKPYVDVKEFGIDIHNEQVPNALMDYGGMLANIYPFSSLNSSSAIKLASKCLNSSNFSRVKMVLYSYDFSDIDMYFEFVRLIQIELNHEIKNGLVYCLIPPWLLKEKSFSITRKMCNHRRTIGLLINGGVYNCNFNLPSHLHLETINNRNLIEIIEGNPLIKNFHDFNIDNVTGVCSKCIFLKYCGNICPSKCFNMTGDFRSSFPNCQHLFDRGRFQNEYLCKL